MILTAIFNAILALGVIVIILTPLVWAILTQHRDDPRLTATSPAPDPQPRRRAAQPSYKPVTGRA
jgi:ABC-type glycerol-3-phosphate transport system permease component